MSKRRRSATIQADPTPQRLAQADGAYELGDDRERKILTMRDSPLERAHLRKAVSQAQYDAGVKYRLHWHHAGLAGNMGSADMNRVFGGETWCGMPKSEFEAHHRQQYRRAVQTLGKSTAKLLDDLVCHETSIETVGYSLGWGSKPQAIAAAMERLRMGLDQLCTLWGMTRA